MYHSSMRSSAPQPVDFSDSAQLEQVLEAAYAFEAHLPGSKMAKWQFVADHLTTLPCFRNHVIPGKQTLSNKFKLLWTSIESKYSSGRTLLPGPAANADRCEEMMYRMLKEFRDLDAAPSSMAPMQPADVPAADEHRATSSSTSFNMLDNEMLHAMLSLVKQHNAHRMEGITEQTIASKWTKVSKELYRKREYRHRPALNGQQLLEQYQVIRDKVLRKYTVMSKFGSRLSRPGVEADKVDHLVYSLLMDGTMAVPKRNGNGHGHGHEPADSAEDAQHNDDDEDEMDWEEIQHNTDLPSDQEERAAAKAIRDEQFHNAMRQLDELGKETVRHLRQKLREVKEQTKTVDAEKAAVKAHLRELEREIGCDGKRRKLADKEDDSDDEEPEVDSNDSD